MRDTKPDRDRAHDELVLQARARLERQAEKLAIILGPHDAGTTFVAIGMTVLAANYGRAWVEGFLRGCADEQQDDDDDTPIDVTPIQGRA